MLKKQGKRMENLLFDYYLVSSSRECEVSSHFTHFLDKHLHEEMTSSAEILDKLVRRLIVQEDVANLFEMGEFPLKDDIMHLKVPLEPFFWTRYDAFCREDGGIFFSEFNYDKPCAQREIVLSETFARGDNPNLGFADRFRDGFKAQWTSFTKQDKKPHLVVLVDPGHFEEVHLAYLYKDLLHDLCESITLAGSHNFSVCDQKVLVFGQEVDIILRQFPTEFLHEVHDFAEILELHNQGKVLLMNDPRAIIGQAKSLFAYFWELVEAKSPLLTDMEADAIRKTIPYTRIFDASWRDRLIREKDQYVIKPIYGRYSIDVFIGNMHSDEEWLEVLEYVIESDNVFVMQAFCPIKREQTLKFENTGYVEKTAFANYGIYLINGNYGGSCIRWSNNYLSEDDVVWTSPIALKHKGVDLIEPEQDSREALWNEINEEAAFEWGYSGGYTGFQESFTLQAMLLTPELKNELETATNKVSQLIQKTVGYVQDHSEIVCPVLGISQSLQALVTQRLTSSLTFVGRMDWVMDNQNNLKLLEFNAETPAGLMESLVLNDLILQKCGYPYDNPNRQMAESIKASFCKIIEDYKQVKSVKTIGFITSNYYEDWYNTKLIYDLVKELPYEFVMGDVAGLSVEDGVLWHSGKPLDAIYRFYPLDWFDEDPYFEGVTEAMHHGTLSINPPATFICQSKAFFALIWELASQAFYEPDEIDLITRYIPKTALTPKRLGTDDYVAKAYFGREGQDIAFSYSGKPWHPLAGDAVYQERLDIQSFDFNKQSTYKTERVTAYPIIGTYVMGDRCDGIFVRAGGRITDNWATFMPDYVKP